MKYRTSKIGFFAENSSSGVEKSEMRVSKVTIIIDGVEHKVLDEEINPSTCSWIAASCARADRRCHHYV